MDVIAMEGGCRGFVKPPLLLTRWRRGVNGTSTGVGNCPNSHNTSMLLCRSQWFA
jgi:hypothetical protein